MKNFLLGCVTGIGIFLAGVLLVLSLGLLPINADADPHWLEEKIATWAKDAYVGKQIGDLKNPFPANADVMSDGMKIFKNNCEGCHGSDTQKDDTFASSLFPKAPQFGTDKLEGERELFWITKHGVRFSGMPGFTKMLSDDDIWKLVTYLTHRSSS